MEEKVNRRVSGSDLNENKANIQFLAQNQFFQTFFRTFFKNFFNLLDESRTISAVILNSRFPRLTSSDTK